MKPPILYWFRRDLRLQDNPALQKALEGGGPIIPVYIHDEAGEGEWKTGGASRWWLHHSLVSLRESLAKLNSRFIVRAGASGEVLEELCEETGAKAVYWNRRYEPAIIARDKQIKQSLRDLEIEGESFNGALLFEPHTIENKQGRPFQVFTPYWRHCLAKGISENTSARVKKLPHPNEWPKSESLDDLELLPLINWTDGFAENWEPGETGALKSLKVFVKSAVDEYESKRDFPHIVGTSQLSPYLHFGEISPQQIWSALQKRSEATGVFPTSKGEQVYLSEIGWREFAHHLLYHFPQTPHAPLRADFERFPWASDPDGAKLRAWQRGLTGYPIVDAGMRELWHTGWMHNRVRMIVASFLVKHLRLPWTLGAAWFWDTLVDADLASNTLGWQWTAGCGADAAPFFRIFAPVNQGEKFDKNGDYVRKWIPELAKLGSKYIQRPWEAPTEVLEAAEIELGNQYPHPIVDHTTARKEALAAFQQLRNSK